MSDKFAMYDAAYLLGALTPADRAEFEAHLGECADCRRSVNSLAGMPGLLASVSPDALQTGGEDPAPPPETLLPSLLREVERSRFRRRWVTGLVGAAAAAAIAVAVATGVTGSGAPLPRPPATAAAALRMTPVSPQIPIHARVALAAKGWGTWLRIWCTYDGPTTGRGSDVAYPYTMVVTDTSGATQQIAAWKAKAGQPVALDASTSVPRSEIASVEVRGPSDVPVLELRL